MFFQLINIRQVPREVLKTAARKKMFDPYIGCVWWVLSGTGITSLGKRKLASHLLICNICAF